MDEARAYEDVDRLGGVLEDRDGAFLHWDLVGAGEVRIEKFRFPSGWSPRRADVIFDLPDDYPQNQPMVYISGDLRWEGDRPHTMYPPRRHGEERFARYCIHELSWDPREDDLETLLDTLEVSLRDPTKRRAVED
ncbi:MAG: E2/UBC family protein [Haloarculaceae archaeon]